MMRYTYIGDKMTRADLIGLQCDPVRRADGKCIVSVKMASALVIDERGNQHNVMRRRLRLNSKLARLADGIPEQPRQLDLFGG